MDIGRSTKKALKDTTNQFRNQIRLERGSLTNKLLGHTILYGLWDIIDGHIVPITRLNI